MVVRPYIIPIADVKPGDILIPDGDFTCMSEGVPRTVHRYGWVRRNLPIQILTLFGLQPIGTTPGADLYVECADGHHTLDGQLNDEGTHLVGFIKGETPVEEEEQYATDLSDEEVVSCEAELTEDVDTFKAGHRFTIMGIEDGKLRLLDDEGNAVLTERSKLKVLEW